MQLSNTSFQSLCNESMNTHHQSNNSNLITEGWIRYYDNSKKTVCWKNQRTHEVYKVNPFLSESECQIPESMRNHWYIVYDEQKKRPFYINPSLRQEQWEKPLLKEHVVKAYYMEEYASNHYDRKKGFFRKYSLESLLSYDPNELTQPLLLMESNLSHIALKINHFIHLYLKTQKNDYIQKIIAYCLVSPVILIDECYCQLLKQLSRCNLQSVTDRITNILLVMTISLQPSDDLHPYIEYFLFSNRNSDMIDQCYTYFVKCNEVGSIKELPTIEEIQTILDNEKLDITVNLVNNQSLQLSVTPLDTVKTVINMISNQLNLGDDYRMFQLFIVERSNEYVINENRRMIDIINELTDSMKLQFSVAFYDSFHFRNQQVLDLVYAQAIHDLQCGKYFRKEDDYFNAIALILQHQLEDYSGDNRLLCEEIDNFLPPFLSTPYKKLFCESEIIKVYSKLKGLSQQECKLSLLEYMKAWNDYGVTHFYCKSSSLGKYEEYILGISPRGILLGTFTDRINKNAYTTFFPYASISAWGIARTSISFYIETKPSQTKYSFELQFPEDAFHLIQHYSCLPLSVCSNLNIDNSIMRIYTLLHDHHYLCDEMPQNINIIRLILTVFSCISVLVSVHISSLFVVHLSDGLIEWKEFDLVRVPPDQLPNDGKQTNRKTILAESHRKRSSQCIDCGSKPIVPNLFVINDKTKVESTPNPDKGTSLQPLVEVLKFASHSQKSNRLSSNELTRQLFSNNSSEIKQLFELYPAKAIQLLRNNKKEGKKRNPVNDVLKSIVDETDTEIAKKADDDDILSLPDITLSEKKKSPREQDRNAYDEKESKVEVTSHELDVDIDTIVDTIPFTTEVEPMGVTIDNQVCQLSLSGIMKKYQGVEMSNYTFVSDEECDYRNNQLDSMIRERENHAKETEEYKSMVNLTLSDETAVYAKDHISIKHTRLIFKELRKKELNITSSLFQQMENDTCFQSVLLKYVNMKKELDSTRYTIWNDIKVQLQKERQESSKNERALSRYVSQGEVYNAYRTYLTNKRVQQRSLFQDVNYFSSENEYCDGCRIPSGIKNLQPIMKYQNHFLIRKFVGDQETDDISSDENPWYAPPGTPYDVTAIAVVYSYNRFFSLRHFLYRFRGPLTLVIHIQQQHEPYVIRFINNHHFPDRLTILLYIVDSEHPFYTVFPINILRNLAIRNIRTTHFLVLDMDLRVSTNTYDELKQLPAFLYRSNTTAVILPIFFFNYARVVTHCTNVENCAYLANTFQPENKVELIACVASKNCYSNKRLIRTHMYTMPEWYLASPRAHVSRVRCFITDFMEPYLMVHYTPNTPLFNPDFVDYGYNKVEYVEHLRQGGFSFYILNHAFATDFPHPDSVFRTSYSENLRKNNVMKVVYNKLQLQFDEMFKNQTSFQLCYTRQPGYYEEIYS